MRMLFKGTAAAVLLVSAATAPAAVTDAAGDYLPTYTGPQDADLDILSGDVTFNGSAFLVTATVAGPIDATSGQLYAWGINRGTGTARIDLLRDPDIAPGILFDAVLVMLPNGALIVVTIPIAGAPSFTTILGGTIIDGTSLSATIPLSLLPSSGLAPEDYTFGLWSRLRVDAANDGSNTEIADFLAGSGALNARVVPEPGTWMTMLLGFGLIGATIRRGRTATAKAMA